MRKLFVGNLKGNLLWKEMDTIPSTVFIGAPTKCTRNKLVKNYFNLSQFWQVTCLDKRWFCGVPVCVGGREECLCSSVTGGAILIVPTMIVRLNVGWPLNPPPLDLDVLCNQPINKMQIIITSSKKGILDFFSEYGIPFFWELMLKI